MTIERLFLEVLCPCPSNPSACFVRAKVSKNFCLAFPSLLVRVCVFLCHPAPPQMSFVISVGRREPMGLRLRDVHPECGGGVVVVGFQRSAAGKRGGLLQGDRITQVDGEFVLSYLSVRFVPPTFQVCCVRSVHGRTGRTCIPLGRALCSSFLASPCSCGCNPYEVGSPCRTRRGHLSF